MSEVTQGGTSRQALGAQGERWAEEVLLEAGMVIVDRNWRCREGEIDLVALDCVEGRSTLVFCEVKYRRGAGFGSPLEAVTAAKVRRLRRLAARWVSEHAVRPELLRLDAIGIVDRCEAEPQITHVRGIE